MRAEHINPFISGLTNTFNTMLNCTVTRGQISLNKKFSPLHEISGIIGLSGKAVGTVIVSFSQDVALKAASTLLMMEATEIDADVKDAVGELTNMVAGASKAQLEEFELSISLPNVVTGSPIDIHFPSEVCPIVVPFTSDWGPLTLEVGLEVVGAPVGV